MGHFLKTCSVANDALPAIYDIMATCNIRQDERASLFTVESIYLLKFNDLFRETFYGGISKTKWQK